MERISLLLPRAYLESIGVSVTDFFRQMLLAEKRALNENLHFRLYPLSWDDKELPLMARDSTEVARWTEHTLARYVVLPGEAELMKLHRKLASDLARPVLPRLYRQRSFYELYLARLSLKILLQAFDALFWYLAQKTSFTLTAGEGLELLRWLFVRPKSNEEGGGITDNERLFKSREEDEVREWELTLNMRTLPYPTDTVYVVVGEDDAPIEGRNTLIVRFADNPPRAFLLVHLPKDEMAVVEASSLEKLELESSMLSIFEQRFDRKPLWVREGDKQGVESSASPL